MGSDKQCMMLKFQLLMNFYQMSIPSILIGWLYVPLHHIAMVCLAAILQMRPASLSFSLLCSSIQCLRGYRSTSGRASNQLTWYLLKPKFPAPCKQTFPTFSVFIYFFAVHGLFLMSLIPYQKTFSFIPCCTISKKKRKLL